MSHEKKKTTYFQLYWLVNRDPYIPRGSMYGIFTYIYHKNQLNVAKYTIHGWYGIGLSKIPT